jgi:hypothetical protein
MGGESRSNEALSIMHYALRMGVRKKTITIKGTLKTFRIWR